MQARIMLENNDIHEILDFYEKLNNDFHIVDIRLCAIDDDIYQYDGSIQQKTKHFKFLDEKLYVKHDNGNLECIYADDLYKDPSIEKTVSFKNWLCNAGFNYLYVHCDGNIYQC